MNLAVRFINNNGFFKRFTEKEISTYVMPRMKFLRFQKNQVIFFSKSSIYILVLGDIIMKSHKQKIFPSKLLARYQEGDILGDVKQEGEWYKSENW